MRRTALLLGVALALRLAVVAQSTALPLLETPLYDSDVYLHQARQIRAGHFGDPSLVAFSPLYGWLLAALGGSVRGAIALQLAMGVVTLALLVRLARQRSGERGALLAGALLCGYGLPLFYETKILSETLGLLLATAGLSLFLDERGRRCDLASGVVLALSVLARASLLFTLPLYLLAALWSPRRLTRALSLALGMAVVLVGNGLWNRAHTGLFVPVILVSRTAAVATQAEWRGDFRVFARQGAPGGDVSPWDVVRQAEERIEASRRGDGGGADQRPLFGVDPLGWIRGAPAKLGRTLADRETTFDYGYYGERSEVGVLGALPVSFGLIEVLALCGALALLVAGRGRALLPLLPLVAGTLITTTLFYPTSRYRLPMVLALVLAAAEVAPLLERLGAAPSGRGRARVAAALLAAIALAFGVRTVSRRPDNPAEWELRVAEAAARAGDLDELARRVRRARAMAPGDPAIEHRIAVIGGAPAQ